MAAQGLSKMSLLAQFDDLCRYTKVLNTGVEEEFKIFVENQLNCMRKWKKTDDEVKVLRNKITILKSTDRRIEEKSIHLKNLLGDANSAVRKLKWEKENLENTITAVRDIVLSNEEVDSQTKEKLSLLSYSYKPSLSSSIHLETIEESLGSFSSVSDYDETYVELENWGSSSTHESHRLKDKKYNFEAATSTEKKESDKTNVILNQKNKKAEQRNKTISTSASHESDIQKSSLVSFKDHRYDMVNTPVSREDSPKHIRRNHQLVSKKVIRSTKCMVCSQSIGSLKRSLKCQTCGVTFHPECKSMCPIFCFPILNTPTKGTAATVADYTPSTSPMIPPLIFHCVTEIESRGLKAIGLYRIPSSKRDVKNVIEKFVSKRIIPTLDDIDVHTLCVAVKEFLCSLSEPLITRESRQAFIDAATLNDSVDSLYTLLELVSNLPQPNRDTLSFLILHWKKIAESPFCKMDSEVLCRILGPPLVGYSMPTAKMIEETTNQYQVMKRLLSISSASWQSVMSVVMSESLKEIPENTTSKRRFLEPVYSFFQERKMSDSSNESYTNKLKNQ